MSEMSNNKSKVRFDHIDIAKGFAIILMVFGHSGMPTTIHDFIYSFHMPFFFFASGVTCNTNYSYSEYIKKKLHTYMVPFAIYGILNILLRSYYHDVSIFNYLESHIYSGCESALWFIPILFFAQILNRLIPSNEKLIVLVIFSFLAVQSIFNLKDIVLPWSLSILPLALVFVLMGRVFSIEIKNYNVDLRYGIIFVLSVCVLLYLVSSNYVLECKDNTQTEPLIVLFVTAFIGCLGLIVMSKILEINVLVNKILCFFGKNTFLIAALSQIILKYENNYIQKYTILKYVLLFSIMIVAIILKNKLKFSKKLYL